MSERNVIELVSKLAELQLIDILYTTDGKTYLTHQQLAKEIKDELIVHGGMIIFFQCSLVQQCCKNYLYCELFFRCKNNQAQIELQ